MKQSQMKFRARDELQSFLLTSTFTTLMLATLFVLASCSLSTARAQRKVRDIASHLPEYPEAVLVERVDGVRGGSDPKCWTAYSVALYGTSQDFEIVLSFYTETMPTLGWQESQFPGLFRNADDVSLEILTDQDAWASLAIPPETRQKSQQQFATVFFVSLAYGNPESREYCEQ